MTLQTEISHRIPMLNKTNTEMAVKSTKRSKIMLEQDIAAIEADGEERSFGSNFCAKLIIFKISPQTLVEVFSHCAGACFCEFICKTVFIGYVVNFEHSELFLSLRWLPFWLLFVAFPSHRC